MQKRLKTLIKKCGDLAELHFIDGPFVLSEQVGDEEQEEQRCWWLPGLARGEPHPDWPQQWEQSHAIIVEEMKRAVEAGRAFDGVFGFSNGAAAAAMLLSSPVLAEIPLRFALFAGGYLPDGLKVVFVGLCRALKFDSECQGRLQCYHLIRAVKLGLNDGSINLLQAFALELPASYFDSEPPPNSQGHSPLNISSLHMMGESDEMVPPVESEKLEALFERPRRLLHEQGHIVPQRSNETKLITGFIRDHVLKSYDKSQDKRRDN